MKKILPTIGASLMLAANVLTGGTDFRLAAHDANVPEGGRPADVASETELDIDNEGANDPYQYYMEELNTEGDRIIIYDNDFQGPEYQKNVIPLR